jgi:NTP pyrophosphatase (non-canonical NTP hydrolase)
MLNDLVLGWAHDRGILDNGTVEGQMAKLQEEFDELKAALKANDREEIEDAIGDMQVVLIILADLMGMDARDALRCAYDVICQRKGKMVDGVFVKEEAA